jgi:hypothetical protein
MSVIERDDRSRLRGDAGCALVRPLHRDHRSSGRPRRGVVVNRIFTGER